MNSLKNNTAKIIIIDSICWLILCITDAYDEFGPTSDMSMYAFYIAPVILCCVFVFFRKWLFGCLLPSNKRVLVINGISFGINLVMVFISDVLIAEDLWIVPQANRILNGIEYPAFGLYMCAISVVFCILEILGRLFLHLYRKRKGAEEL